MEFFFLFYKENVRNMKIASWLHVDVLRHQLSQALRISPNMIMWIGLHSAVNDLSVISSSSCNFVITAEYFLSWIVNSRDELTTKLTARSVVRTVKTMCVTPDGTSSAHRRSAFFTLGIYLHSPLHRLGALCPQLVLGWLRGTFAEDAISYPDGN